MTRLYATVAAVLLGCAHSPTHEVEPAQKPPAVSGDDVSGVVLRTDPDAIAAGAAVFARYCAACHAPSTTQRVGPDLTDDRWIHGDSPSAVYRVIWSGVKPRGMPAWGGLLDERQVADVTAYVLASRAGSR